LKRVRPWALSRDVEAGRHGHGVDPESIALKSGFQQRKVEEAPLVDRQVMDLRPADMPVNRDRVRIHGAGLGYYGDLLAARPWL
jgi:hypothetical protein